MDAIAAPVKPGYRTTEFWLSLLTTAGAVTAAAAHILPGPWAGVLAAVSTGAYSLSRGLAKS